MNYQRLAYTIVHSFFILLLPLSCFDDGNIPGPKGVLKVKVNTSEEIWGYPQLSSGSITDYETYKNDISALKYKWQYPETGGSDGTGLESDLANLPINADDVGDKFNAVYLYSQLGEGSKIYPVFYQGKSTSNNEVITISDIEPGIYYVVAFYDYCAGGNQENLLNRYDRYAIYTSTDPLDATANSTPYQDKASTVTISENQVKEINLEIKRDWLLGKPYVDGGTGRIFLKSTDPIPSPDGTYSEPRK